MELREYLFRREIKKGDFAALVGTSPKTIWALSKGMQDVKLSIALKIEEVTQGEVTCRDLARKATRGKVRVEDLMERERTPVKRNEKKDNRPLQEPHDNVIDDKKNSSTGDSQEASTT